MHLVFLTDSMKFSGGRKLLLEYAQCLSNTGHKVQVLVNRPDGELANIIPFEVVPEFSAATIPECDLIVASKPFEVADAWNAKRGKVVHFCQGFEITDLEQRLEGKVLPDRYAKGGILNHFKLTKKKKDWANKISEYDRIYRLPTHLVTIASSQQKLLHERYHREVHLCINGVRQEYFYPNDVSNFESFSVDNPMRIINVGPYDVTFKGIPTTLEAIESLKKQNLPIHFIRVTPKAAALEKDHGAIDELHVGISQDELGKLLRSCHVYVSNSTEGEGFGLPAMEALSCALVCVLSNITSYRSFASETDYALFVPEGNSAETAKAFERILHMDNSDIEEIRRKALQVSTGYSFTKAASRFSEILHGLL